jgi:hypothetical protein
VALLHRFGRRQLILGCGVEEGGVRHAVPERVGEPGGGSKGLPLRVGGLFEPEQEVGRLEHRFDGELGAVVEIGSFAHERFVSLLLLGFEWPAEGLQPELADELGAARRRRFAGDQATGVTAAEGIAGELFGCRAVGFQQQRREILGLVLILEAVHKVFGRELVSRRGLVAE